MFWDETCGTAHFNKLGLKEINSQTLKTFDNYYLNYYPYLPKYISPKNLKNKAVLEIGLGFGTLGQVLFSNSKKYLGLDYAENPVSIMKKRILWAKKSKTAKALQGDALKLPFKNNEFDTVVSIGCLHHTGNTQKAIDEIFRVLKKSGTAVIMLYNKNSLRQKFLLPLLYLLIGKGKYKNYEEFNKSFYDVNTKGEVAPIIEYYSKNDVRRMFSKFSKISIFVENFDDLPVIPKKLYLSRKLFLGNIAKLWGLDLYIVTVK